MHCDNTSTQELGVVCGFCFRARFGNRAIQQKKEQFGVACLSSEVDAE